MQAVKTGPQNLSRQTAAAAPLRSCPQLPLLSFLYAFTHSLTIPDVSFCHACESRNPVSLPLAVVAAASRDVALSPLTLPSPARGEGSIKA